MDLLKGQTLSRSGVSEAADDALADKQVILFYFCASWCPPSRVFTPILHEFYNELTKEEEPLEVVVVSADDSADSMRRFLKTHCPPTWLLTQSEATTERLKKQFSVTGTPTLVAVSATSSRPLTTAARGEVTERGVAVFREWLAIAKAEKTSMDHS